MRKRGRVRTRLSSSSHLDEKDAERASNLDGHRDDALVSLKNTTRTSEVKIKRSALMTNDIRPRGS